MAQTWDTRRLAHERAMYARLKGEITGLAEPITRIILRHATESRDGQRVIPNQRKTRERLHQDVWNQAVKPYFIGPGTDPLIGQVPQSPYMRQIVDGITGAIQIQAERQVSIVNKLASDRVRDWLTGPRALTFEMVQRRAIREQGPDRTPWYDAFHLFVDPNGYRLSDNGWRTSIETRKAIDNLLEYHIRIGTAAVDIADQLEPYLWPEAARIRTRTPYGVDGSYWARRLSRTEITAAAGRSLVNASLINPYVTGIKWNLSLTHPDPDICDDNAHGGDGNGVYAKDDVPQYPAHPHEKCTLTPEVTTQPAAVNRQIETWIDQRAPEAEALRGAFNLDWLVQALITGALVSLLEDGKIDWRQMAGVAV